LHGMNNENVLYQKEHFFAHRKNDLLTVPAMQHGYLYFFLPLFLVLSFSGK